MSELVTLVITADLEFEKQILSSMNEDRHGVLFVKNVEQSITVIENSEYLVSNIVCEIPKDIAALEKSLRILKRNKCAKYIPCIGVLTSNSSNDPVSRPLFFHILKMPLKKDTLPHTIEAAQSDFKRYQALLGEVNSRTSAIGLIQSGNFKLQTLEQAEALTTMLSLACPDPAVVALGLSELLVNAIEHGNLDITYEEKSKLLETGDWDKEIKQRLKEDKYKDKLVEIVFSRREEQIDIVVRDQGNGFDWQKYINNDPSNFNSKHGRGIAIAIAMGFNNIKYNDYGNEVTATIKL